MLQRAALWSLHTSSSPDPTAHSADVPYDRVLHTNSDIRRLAHELRFGLADWDAMAHLGWQRSGGVSEGSFIETSKQLKDNPWRMQKISRDGGQHSGVGLNSAYANLYLNALAVVKTGRG